MVKFSEEKVIDYILKSDTGRIKTNNGGKQLKKIIVDDKTYSYDKNKPISKVFNKKLAKIARTDDYKKTYSINERC